MRGLARLTKGVMSNILQVRLAFKFGARFMAGEMGGSQISGISEDDLVTLIRLSTSTTIERYTHKPWLFVVCWFDVTVVPVNTEHAVFVRTTLTIVSYNDTKLYASVKSRMASESGIDRLVLGPMPARQFIEVFFPFPRQDSRPSAFREGMFERFVRLVQAHTKDSEASMYQPFVRILYLLLLRPEVYV
jgi:hypothetical protein